MKLKQMEWDFGQRFRDAGTITENETSTRKSGKVKNGKFGKKDMKELESKNRKLSWEQSKSTQKRVPEQDQPNSGTNPDGQSVVEEFEIEIVRD